jgi:Uncharacterized conserved protein
MTDTDSSVTIDRFLLDAMLGSLSTYLRMCGYDAAYVRDEQNEQNDNSDESDLDTSSNSAHPTDDEILARATDEERTIITRDTELAKRADDAILLSTRDVEDQLGEFAASGYDLDLTLRSRSGRCGACNGRVEAVSSDAVVPEYAPDPDKRDCWQCLRCEQIFWKGSHWEDVAATLEHVRTE